MNVMYLPCGSDPEVLEIDGSLEEMQRLVGGNIELISLTPDMDLWCNEDYYSMYEESHVNAVATYLVSQYSPGTQMMMGCILGNCFLSGGTDPEGETLGLSPTAIAALFKLLAVDA